ncbi:MAG TPA: Rv2578c family radical SAM protein [Jiangellaceae bacterium]
MRWEPQTIDAEDDAALPGMGKIAGLLRSVQTPDFAGVTFHEVRAKSVLNRVPGESNMPFQWTVNPYRGCTHACVYCLDGETPVLMSNGRTRPLADIRVGDTVVGTEQRRLRRRYVETTVTAHWRTTKAAYRLELADGTTFMASGDHRFLTTQGWRRVGDMEPGEQFVGDARLRRLPRHAQNRSILGSPVGTDKSLQVATVEPTGSDAPMYDMTTGTGDFIADGVVSHNCFARGSHSWLELDTGVGFDTEIVVKVNAGDVLARELHRRSWTREHVALGTNTDPYQRAEGRYRLMPGIIRALANSGTPFSILTKGTLLRRDLPLLSQVARHVDVSLAVSVAIYDDELHAALEPGTPSPRARLDLVRAIRDAGFDCTVLLAPVIPYLTDTEKHLSAALEALAGAGATHVTPIPLHLRTGAREWFFTWLQREHPKLMPRYENLYRQGAYVPKSYQEWLDDRLDPLLHSYDLDGSRSLEARSKHRGGGRVEHNPQDENGAEQLTLL